MDVRAPHLVVEHPEHGALYRSVPEQGRLTVGRGAWCDIVIGWDPSVSRTHAVIERFGSMLTIEPAGEPTNALTIKSIPLRGRVPLEDGQAIKLGDTLVYVRLPPEAAEQGTVRLESAQSVPEPLVPLTRRQREVVLALEADPDATNRQLGERLGLSIETIRTHLKEATRKARDAGAPDPIDRTQLADVLRDAGQLE
jgi:DNA-binding CsgD family transcriptional regulator